MEINKNSIHYIFVSLILVLFIIVSINIPPETIIAEINNKEIIYSHDFMSGGEDDIALAVAAILFIPITIINIINIFRKNKIDTLLIFLITIFLQIFLTYMWFEYGNILLNILYGTILFKLWIFIFSLIIIYTIFLIIKKIEYIYRNIFNSSQCKNL